MSLYISPNTSEEGGTPVVNAKPQLNKSLMGKQRAQGFIPPEGMLLSTNRTPVESRQWGNTPFFTNAKAASMLERGWIRSLAIRLYSKGLVVFDDGPEVMVTVMDIIKMISGTRYIMKNNSTGEEFVLHSRDRYSEWDFYMATAPVPFVPRSSSGGSKKKRSKKATRKLRKRR